MKIAIVIERYAPQSGGAERSTAEVAAELRSRGHDVTIFTGAVRPVSTKTHEFSTQGRGSLSVAVCPFGSPKGISRLILFRRWVRRKIRKGYDASLSVTSSVPAQVVQPRAGLIPDLQNRSLAWRRSAAGRRLRQFVLAINFRQKLLRALEAWTFRAPEVKHIACISDMIRRHCAAHYPDVATKLVHIGNAVKPVRATAGECVVWRERIRAEWKCREDTTAFFLPSLDSRRKGLTPLLHAMALLRKEAPDLPVMLAVCGQVHSTQARLIQTLNLGGCVQQIGFRKDLRPYYVASDVTVLPTYYDSFGRVVIEALMLGRPSITTAWAGAAELVQPLAGNERHGRVVDDPDDIPALARAMRDLCDPAERQRCVAGTERILETHTISRHVDALVALFESARPLKAQAVPVPSSRE
ncbi:MAG TPA: glycosyltransferase family 4 protein [Phycisphaerae bacterium]|jgi:glycosyltransferase involved in cell wall biosynthesis|nr:glycosyltransferase family 4 protein [Phycisphaerae bacterium]